MNVHVLHDEGIYAYSMQLLHQRQGLWQFIVVEECVDGHIDFCAKQVCVGHQPGDVFNTVASGCPCSKLGASNINGIGTVADGLDANVCCTCGCKKFKRLH